jgi:polysaccharide export outer membrane protein
VRVFNRPQLSLEATRVDARGMIRMPLIETEIQAACHTESELAQLIAEQYREYQRNPQAFVLVKEYNSQPVAVIGAVEKPGRIQLQRRVRLLELLSFVGGPSDKAGLRVHIAHAGSSTSCDPDGRLVAVDKSADELDIYTLSETLMGDPQSNPYARPGDIVSIPEAEQAFVVGNVYKPSAIPLKVPIRFSEAIAMAGGTLPDSNLDQIRLVRQVPGMPVKQEQFINLKKINQRKTEDLMLLAGDIVEVPTLTGRKLLRGLLTTMGPALVNLPLLILR